MRTNARIHTNTAHDAIPVFKININSAVLAKPFGRCLSKYGQNGRQCVPSGRTNGDWEQLNGCPREPNIYAHANNKQINFRIFIESKCIIYVFYGYFWYLANDCDARALAFCSWCGVLSFARCLCVGVLSSISCCYFVASEDGQSRNCDGIFFLMRQTHTTLTKSIRLNIHNFCIWLWLCCVPLCFQMNLL